MQAPPKESKVLFLQYAALEENYGLARSAMEVYDKAIQTVPQSDRLSVYDLYLARASDFFGIAKVRSHLLKLLSLAARQEKQSLKSSSAGNDQTPESRLLAGTHCKLHCEGLRTLQGIV